MSADPIWLRMDATVSRLRGDALTHAFPGGAGIRDVDITVEAGEIHALVGLNGAGKTTLLRVLLGMLRPDTGTVRIDGHSIDRVDAEAWARVGHNVEQPATCGELDSHAALALAMQHDPDLIVLDEPTTALDARSRILLRESLLRRAHDHGAGVLVSGHRLDEVVRIADRISVIDHGRILGALDPSASEIEREFLAMIDKD